MPHCLAGRLHKFSGILCRRRLSYSCTFVYLLTYLHQPGLVSIYLYFGVKIQHYQLILLLKIVPTLDMGSSFSLAPMSLGYASSLSFLGAFSYFLAGQLSPGLSSIFSWNLFSTTNQLVDFVQLVCCV